MMEEAHEKMQNVEEEGPLCPDVVGRIGQMHQTRVGGLLYTITLNRYTNKT